MTIRERIRRRLRAGGDLSPAAISADILDGITDPEILPALAAALPYLVRDEIRKRRHDAIGRRGPEERGAATWKALDDDLPASEEAAAVAATSAKLRAAGRKGFDRAQGRRERDSRLLQTPICVRPGEWRPLGDCTPEDLRIIARGLHERAAENEARADAWEELAAAMDLQGARIVRDLEQGQVREAVGAVV